MRDDRALFAVNDRNTQRLGERGALATQLCRLPSSSRESAVVSLCGSSHSVFSPTTSRLARGSGVISQSQLRNLRMIENTVRAGAARRLGSQ